MSIHLLGYNIQNSIWYVHVFQFYQSWFGVLWVEVRKLKNCRKITFLWALSWFSYQVSKQITCCSLFLTWQPVYNPMSVSFCQLWEQSRLASIAELNTTDQDLHVLLHSVGSQSSVLYTESTEVYGFAGSRLKHAVWLGTSLLTLQG